VDLQRIGKGIGYKAAVLYAALMTSCAAPAKDHGSNVPSVDFLGLNRTNAVTQITEYVLNSSHQKETLPYGMARLSKRDYFCPEGRHEMQLDSLLTVHEATGLAASLVVKFRNTDNSLHGREVEVFADPLIYPAPGASMVTIRDSMGKTISESSNASLLLTDLAGYYNTRKITKYPTGCVK
jgi:hypothetical protein